MFGAPIRRVDRRIKQEGPDDREFALEMCGETLDVRHATGSLKAFGEAGDELPSDHGQSMRGDNTGVVAVADGERPLQDRLHVGGKGGVRVIGGEQSTPAKKMGETGLMSRSREAPVTRSANQLRHRIASNKRRVRASCFLMLEGG